MNKEARCVQEQLLRQLESLNKNIRQASVPLNDRLWSLADIAEYIQLSVYTTSQRVVNAPNFPKPVGLTSKRWLAGDVIEWAKNSRGKLPRKRCKD